MDSHLTVKIKHPITDQELVEAVLLVHPECKYGKVVPGISIWFEMTRVVRCWREEACSLAGEPALFESNSFSGNEIEINEEDVREAQGIIDAGTEPETVIKRAQYVVAEYNKALKA